MDATESLPNTCRTCVSLWTSQEGLHFCVSKKLADAAKRVTWGIPINAAYHHCAGTYWVKR